MLVAFTPVIIECCGVCAQVIDYSLLVAVDESTGEIMMGLIDYVRIVAY